MESPCVRKCTLNEQDMCLGCGRELNEITAWTSYSEKQRAEIIKDCVQRIALFGTQTSLKELVKKGV